ncbi:MAG TPA: hypothetical protein VFV38_45780, partial [Ktedonobacteraceae bacterium]|nr:hypothetical protein [Ktedonobacteraceae bacterium]
LAVLTVLLVWFLGQFSPKVRVSSVSSWSLARPTVVKLEAYSVVGKPTVSAAFLNRVLVAYGSPAAGLGQTMYNDGVHFGVDPVYALAFFLHEDGMGTTGWGAVNRSLGNTRCTPGYQCRGGYRAYASWAAGFWGWFNLIRVQYVNTWHLVTVDQIIPVYAPSSDGNNVRGYITAIKSAVDVWRSGRLEV